MRSSLPKSTRKFCTAVLDTVVLVDKSREAVELSCAPGVSAVLCSAVIAARLALYFSCFGRRFSSPSAALFAICLSASTARSKMLITSWDSTAMLRRPRSSRSSTLWRNFASALNSSREALPLMVCAARKRESINARSSGCVSNAKRDCSICARHSSVSIRNDCNNISRLISMIPLKCLSQGFARAGAKHDSLASVRTHFGGNHGDLCFHEHFQSDIDVSAAQVLFSVRIRITQGIKQAAASEH